MFKFLNFPILFYSVMLFLVKDLRNSKACNPWPLFVAGRHLESKARKIPLGATMAIESA